MPMAPASLAMKSVSLEGALTVGILSVGLVGFWTASLVLMYGSAVAGAVLLPRNALPGLALWLLVLLPTGFMRAGIPVALGDFVTPAVTVIAIWMIRLALVDRATLVMRTPIRGGLIALPFFALLLASAVGTDRVGLTSAWVAVLAVCVVAPAVLGQICVDDIWPGVRRAFAGIGIFLGILAATEFLFDFNPWAAHYLRPDISPKGSVFRSLTSLGHPLTTSLVASVGLVVCIYPSLNDRRRPYLMGALGSLVAVVFSVSRGAVLAIGVGLLVGLVPMVRGSGRSGSQQRGLGKGGGRLITALLAAGFFAAVIFSPFLKDRSASVVGSNSALYRSAVFENAKNIIAQRPLLGFGPGTSERVYGLNYGRLGSLENSALQLIVSIGIPAFILFALAICAVVAIAMRRLRSGAAAGIATFFIAAAGFNVIDTGPAFFAVISPLIICAVMPRCGDPSASQRGPENFSQGAYAARLAVSELRARFDAPGRVPSVQASARAP